MNEIFEDWERGRFERQDSTRLLAISSLYSSMHDA